MKDSSNFEALDYTLPGAEYLRPRRNIIIEMDNQWNLPVILFDFDAWIHNSVRLWPEREKEGQRERERGTERERERKLLYLVLLQIQLLLTLVITLFFSY